MMMKKALVLVLTDEELIELERILIDEDREAAFVFLRRHVGNKAIDALEKRGHCKPWFEVFGGSPDSSQTNRQAGG